MNRVSVVTGALLGLLAIVLGAFGAHGLEKWIAPSELEMFEVGVRYQMYHALLLLFLGVWPGLSSRQKKEVYLFLVAGILLFSYSLYLLALHDLIVVDFRGIGFLTPIGGGFLIVGWLLVAYYTVRQNH